MQRLKEMRWTLRALPEAQKARCCQSEIQVWGRGRRKLQKRGEGARVPGGGVRIRVGWAGWQHQGRHFPWVALRWARGEVQSCRCDTQGLRASTGLRG